MARMKKRRAWTQSDERTLRNASRKHLPAPRVAKKLKRTEGATRQKAFAMGLSLEARPGVIG